MIFGYFTPQISSRKFPASKPTVCIICCCCDCCAAGAPGTPVGIFGTIDGPAPRMASLGGAMGVASDDVESAFLSTQRFWSGSQMI